MAADANIFAQYLKPVKSMQDYTNDMDTAEQNRLTLQSSRMKAQQDQQDMSDNNAFRALIAGGVDMNTPEGQARMYGVAPKRAGELLKSRSDLLKTNKEIEGLGTTQDAAKFKLAADRHAIYKKTIGALASDPALSKDMVLQAGQELVQAQIITPEMFQSATASLPDDPNALRSRLNQGVAGQMSAKEIMEVFAPKTEYKDNGKTLVPVQMNPLAPGYTPPVAIEKEQTPDSVAGNLQSNTNSVRSTNASLENAKAVRDAAKTQGDATKAAASIQRDQATEMKLADDYRAQSKAFGESSSAYKQINATLDSATTSPAATLAAATKFMKILDPGSVVRESELGMALAASGVIDRAVNYMSTLQSGQKLTKTQAADFKDISGKMFKAAQQVQQTIDADYKAKAKAYGLRPEMVTQDLGQNTDQSAGWSITKVPK